MARPFSPGRTAVTAPDPAPGPADGASPSPAPAAAAAPEAAPGVSPGDAFAVTMLEAAAARPVEEVADLLHHLGSERTSRLAPALQRAVATRPVEDLARLLALLRPDAPASAAEILRAAVLTRSADDVARLTALLGTDPDSGIRDALCEAAALRPVADVAHLTQLLHSIRSGASPAHSPAPAAPPGPGAEAPGGAGADAEDEAAAAAGARGGRGPVARLRPARSPLRWFAAAALVASGGLHLSIVSPYWGQNRAADIGFTALAALCVVLAVALVVRDRLWLWIAAAVTGMSTVIGYVLSDRLFVLDLGKTLTPWQSRLGLATLACAATLIALTLLLAAGRRRRRPAGPVRSGAV
ncbi:hypothetical protein ABT247_09180 [Kitasatospora sp. NPDC001539]|uniref:hypothetical protein n=1 Tax=Kitasatospora sp. NPDC001539 TaxID=3154384 RepID=UPI00331D64A3